MPNPIWRYLFIAAVIGAIIAVIVLIVKKIKGKPASNSESEPETPSAPPTPSPAAFSRPTASAPTAKIFINGGRPAGALMGKLYVDGRRRDGARGPHRHRQRRAELVVRDKWRLSLS